MPVGGFKAYPIKIEKSFCSPYSLPVAHTCFNQLDVPEYPSKEIMKEKFLKAINEGQKGFHII